MPKHLLPGKCLHDHRRAAEANFPFLNQEATQPSVLLQARALSAWLGWQIAKYGSA